MKLISETPSSEPTDLASHSSPTGQLAVFISWIKTGPGWTLLWGGGVSFTKVRRPFSTKGHSCNQEVILLLASALLWMATRKFFTCQLLQQLTSPSCHFKSCNLFFFSFYEAGAFGGIFFFLSEAKEFGLSGRRSKGCVARDWEKRRSGHRFWFLVRLRLVRTRKISVLISSAGHINRKYFPLLTFFYTSVRIIIVWCSAFLLMPRIKGPMWNI